MHRHDFSEPEFVESSTMLKNGSKVSKERKTFMEIFEKGTSLKDNRYVVLLPFRNPNSMVPNNKKTGHSKIDGAQKIIYEGQQILPELSQVYGQSVKKWLCKKVRSITIREDLVYPSPRSVPPQQTRQNPCCV